MPIPKIIHQLWIGSLPCPTNCMQTWREQHPDFKYICWNEERLRHLHISLELKKKIDSMQEICGKADIYRWFILYQFGGIFIDADSICIESLGCDMFLNTHAFASYENETVRKGLVSVGTMGFVKKYPLCENAILWILQNNIIGKRAWQTTGPMLLTQLLISNPLLYKDFTIFPSYYFLPVHYTGQTYTGHGKVYSHQLWGSTKQNYTHLPFTRNLDAEPIQQVSLLIASYNTTDVFLKECLTSIQTQQGNFGIEIVWINDGSDEQHTFMLEQLLQEFLQHSRFIKIVYKKKRKNKGLSCCLHEGVLLCNNDIVFRMDSDDIMLPDRMNIQLKWMQENPDCVLCGTDIVYFKETWIGNSIKKIYGQRTTHAPCLTWSDYTTAESPSLWILNHPTLCFKKTAVIEVGNYNRENIHSFEDLELELKILKKYGAIYNIPQILLQYRIHPNQITFEGKVNTSEYVMHKKNFIESLLL